MGKLNTTPRIVQVDPVLQRELREHANQVNMLTEGKLSAFYNAVPAAPTTGTWSNGDFIRKSNPVEAGSVSSKYVIFGWMYVGGVWLECRFLTGN